jgi:pimeloyl-ACP methyl ester carboxylesterase
MRLHFLEWPGPDDDVVILLHGGGLDAHTWDGIAPALTDGYRCYALDQRGHGDSEWSPNLEYGIHSHARDLEAFVEQLGADRFFLVGHSLGAFVALRFAAANPHRVAGLVAVDATPFAQHNAQVERLLQFATKRTEFTSVDDAVDYTLGFQPQRDRESLRASIARSLRRHPDGRWTWKHDRRHMGTSYIAAVIEEAHALLDDVDQVRCPTLVIRGSHGCAAEDASRFAQLLFDGRWTTVGGAGHNVHRDNPAGFIDALRPFLDGAARLGMRDSGHA